MTLPNRYRALLTTRFTRALILSAAAVLTACEMASPAQRAGIAGEFTVNVPDEPGFTRVRVTDLASDIPKAIDKPDKTLLFIFNHGTRSSQIWQTCKPETRPNVTTQLITNGEKLFGAEAKSFEYALYYLCSTVTGGNNLIRKRSSEILEVIDQFRAAGIPSKHIFLVGHSGGASSALVAAVRAPEKVNAVIASAPGYGYAHLGAQGDAFTEVKDIKRQWQTETSVNDRLDALVFAYADDRFSPPADMEFLERLEGVELVSVPPGESSCRGAVPHAFFFTTCLSLYEATIFGYLRQRLR